MQVRCDVRCREPHWPRAVCIREDVGEASVGEHIGQPSSRDSLSVVGADAVDTAEDNMFERDNASAQTTRRGRRPWHVGTLLVREPGRPPRDEAFRQVGAIQRFSERRSLNISECLHPRKGSLCGHCRQGLSGVAERVISNV